MCCGILGPPRECQDDILKQLSSPYDVVLIEEWFARPTKFLDRRPLDGDLTSTEERSVLSSCFWPHTGAFQASGSPCGGDLSDACLMLGPS